jgi:hypothetical protein
MNYPRNFTLVLLLAAAASAASAQGLSRAQVEPNSPPPSATAT